MRLGAGGKRREGLWALVAGGLLLACAREADDPSGAPGAGGAPPASSPVPAPVPPPGSSPASPPVIPTSPATPPGLTDPAPGTTPPGMTPPGTPDPGPAPGPPPPPAPVDPTSGAKLNGFRLNGLRLAAFKIDGRTLEGIRKGGLSRLAANPDFVAWFERADGADLAFHAELMTYLAACALGAGESATYTDASGRAHQFSGDLGLARSWASPGQSSDGERHAVTACLMAHANTALPEPRHIQIALRGPAPFPASPPAVASVLSTFDGAFFGDLFSAPAHLYVCNLTSEPPPNYQSALLRDWGRECYFAKDGCAAVFTVVDCNRSCTAGGPAVGYVWGPTCTVDGRSFTAVNAYVPGYRAAASMAMGGGAVPRSCPSCFGARALSLSALASWARSDWRLLVGGAYVLDVHYADSAQAGGAPQATHLRVEVDGTMLDSGAGEPWEFPATGGPDSWRQRSIPVSLTPSSTIVLRGAGAAGPTIDAVWLRMP